MSASLTQLPWTSPKSLTAPSMEFEEYLREQQQAPEQPDPAEPGPAKPPEAPAPPRLLKP
ncbi:hypothetical protein [Actinomadura luteofluorescens]|uniref:hypothetical protein n=1 Tax=Actinomadura luteofluorescens TaxID=46163 RepID=UPI0030D3D6A2